LKTLKKQRNNTNVTEALSRLRRAAEQENGNLMPFIMEAVKEYATLGEICGALREAFGEYKPPSIF
jgi:methylmalonyl-CoA mutase N-terminal domain/subunit